MSRTWDEVAARLKLRGGAHPGLRRRAEELELDVSHFVRVGMVDTREVLFDDEDHPATTRLSGWASQRVALEHRIEVEIMRLRDHGVELREIADAAGLSVLEVAKIVGAGRAG